jgi:RNA polymerase sigma-70 factor (ECF subfamily)
MADSFYIIFTKIEQLKENNAFVGWCKKITVNECLRQLKQNINFNLYLEDTKIINLAHDETDSSLLENDLLQLLKLLPDGCKTIFNLFVIEGYSHKEIAQQLQISEGTSKSQLNVAKTKLKELVQLHFYHQAK